MLNLCLLILAQNRASLKDDKAGHCQVIPRLQKKCVSDPTWLEEVPLLDLLWIAIVRSRESRSPESTSTICSFAHGVLDDLERPPKQVNLSMDGAQSFFQIIFEYCLLEDE